MELFAKSGADAWFTPESDTILSAETKCPHCGGDEVREGNGHLRRVAGIGRELSGAHRRRAGLSLAVGSCISKAAISTADGFSLPCSAPWARTARPPYKGVVTPGWTLDEKGQAMSKSRGNDVDPVDIASRLGGEVVRLWVASVDFREDVVGSEKLMQRVGENYRKIRNKLFATFWEICTTSIRRPMRFHSRRWKRSTSTCCARPAALARDVRKWYDEFAFHKIYHRGESFLHRGPERVLFRCASKTGSTPRSEFARDGVRRRPRSGASAKP